LRAKSRQLITAAVALVLVAGVTTLAQSGIGQRALRHVGVGSTPTRYTELAFVDPANLPNIMRRAPGRLPTAFTITNHEHAATTYRWQIVATDLQSRVLDSGEVLVDQGHRAYVDPLITTGCSSRTRFTVQLSSGEHIGFWANCIRP
jgi:hypothetical protein